MKKLNPLFPALLGAILVCGSTFSGEPGSLAAGKVTFSASLTKITWHLLFSLTGEREGGTHDRRPTCCFAVIYFIWVSRPVLVKGQGRRCP